MPATAFYHHGASEGLAERGHQGSARFEKRWIVCHGIFNISNEDQALESHMLACCLLSVKLFYSVANLYLPNYKASPQVYKLIKA